MASVCRLLGDVAVSLSDARGRDVAIETVDNGNNTFEVMFVPESAGHVTAKVFFADVEVPGSPFVVDVQPHPSAADQPDSGSYIPQIIFVAKPFIRFRTSHNYSNRFLSYSLSLGKMCFTLFFVLCTT